MKRKNLWLLSGIPGSGKSTWVTAHASKDAIIVSRDKIRFSKLKEDDPYFKYESEVFGEYCKQIKEALEDPEVDEIWADATQMTPGARLKTIVGISPNFEEVNINCINFNIPLKVCLERNEQRKGLSYVPRAQIRRMHESFTPATTNETFGLPFNKELHHYDWIVNIDAKGREEWLF